MFRKIIENRLSTAWLSATIGRVGAFFTIVLIAHTGVDTDAAAAFVVVFSASGLGLFVANTVTEGLVLKSSGGTDGSARWLGVFIVIAGALGLLLFVVTEDHFLAVLGLGIVFVQYWIAQERVSLIKAEQLWVPNSSPLFRDSVVIAVVLSSWLLNAPLSTSALVGALLVGSLLQLSVLGWRSGRCGPRAADVGGPHRREVVALALAGGLFAAQPFAIRAMLTALRASDTVFQYEMADRLSYVLTLVVMGGIGTEFQRRWSQGG